MLASLLAQADGFARPAVDWHALAPELVVTGVLCLVLVADLFLPEDRKALLPSLAGLGLLGALVPILTLAVDGADRQLFGGAYAVDDFALVLKALFLVAGYVIVLQSTNYIAEGDYAEGEYYFLLLSSILGMLVMASARDLITIFVALEMLSDPRLPAGRLAQARPQGQRGGRQVLPDGRVRHGRAAVRHVAGLRGGGQHQAGRHRRGPGHGRVGPHDHAGGGVLHRRVRVQGVGRAVPHLGARHLRGRAHARSPRSCRCRPRRPGSWRCWS